MSAEPSRPPSRLRVWLTAVRPFAYGASVLPVGIGTVLAVWQGVPLDWRRFAIALLGVLCFHTGAVLLNDCYDHRRGVDTEVYPTSGAVVRGWLSERQARNAGLLASAVGVLCGGILVWLAGWVVLLLGALGAVCALGYTLPGTCLKYAGLGDLAVLLTFGPLTVFGSYWVQAEAFSWIPIAWSLPVVALSVGILHANNWYDIRRDSAAGCHTLAARLGEKASGVYYRGLVLAPFVLVVVYLAAGWLAGMPARPPLAVAAVFLALPQALALVRRSRLADGHGLPGMDAATAQVQLLFSLLLAAAFLAVRLAAG